MQFRTWLESADDLEVVRSSDATQKKFGNAAAVSGGSLVGYHVTDNPQRILDIWESGKKFTATYRKGVGKTNELGPGLYVSAAPQMWVGRSVGKWDFLKTLTPDQKQRLAAALRQDRALTGMPLDDGRVFKYVSDREAESAHRYIDEWLASGHDPILVFLAGQPYNIRFWTPEYLRPLGIEASGQPKMLKVTFNGAFVNLSRHIGDWPVIADCIRKGYDGGFNPGGMVSNPEMCIWRRECVRDIELDQ